MSHVTKERLAGLACGVALAVSAQANSAAAQDRLAPLHPIPTPFGRNQLCIDFDSIAPSDSPHLSARTQLHVMASHGSSEQARAPNADATPTRTTAVNLSGGLLQGTIEAKTCNRVSEDGANPALAGMGRTRQISCIVRVYLKTLVMHTLPQQIIVSQFLGPQ